MKVSSVTGILSSPSQNSWKKGNFVIPGNPGEGRGRPGIQDFQAILDSGACPGLDPGFAGMTV